MNGEATSSPNVTKQIYPLNQEKSSSKILLVINIESNIEMQRKTMETHRKYTNRKDIQIFL